MTNQEINFELLLNQIEQEFEKGFSDFVKDLLRPDNFSDLAVVFKLFIQNGMTMSKTDIVNHRLYYNVNPKNGKRTDYVLMNYYPNREILKIIHDNKDFFMKMDDYYAISYWAMDILAKIKF